METVKETGTQIDVSICFTEYSQLSSLAAELWTPCCPLSFNSACKTTWMNIPLGTGFDTHTHTKQTVLHYRHHLTAKRGKPLSVMCGCLAGKRTMLCLSSRTSKRTNQAHFSCSLSCFSEIHTSFFWRCEWDSPSPDPPANFGPLHLP